MFKFKYICLVDAHAALHSQMKLVSHAQRRTTIMCMPRVLSGIRKHDCSAPLLAGHLHARSYIAQEGALEISMLVRGASPRLQSHAQRVARVAPSLFTNARV
eukprot:6199556-Pleurochrysis_carterae.AAC.1